MNYIIFWVIICIVALLIDIITSSFFFAGFTIGGIAALIAQILGYPILNQWMIFSLVSVAAVAFEFLWLRTKLTGTIPKTLKMEDKYIGSKITLDEDVDTTGRAKIKGIYWTVQNVGDPIKKGEKAEIVKISGNKMVIKK
jgi:membrane protein implicated in regulation of membrane protease activity